MSATNSTIVANPHDECGLRIADRFHLRPTGTVWHVPSESSDDRYKVDPEADCCSCPDNQVRRVKCKHLVAVEITLRRETVQTVETVQHPDGTATTTARRTVKTVKTARVTYAQNWPAYNAAQTHEKDTFLTLLHALCRGIPEPPQEQGRPRLPLADMVFAAAFNVYVGFSGRRFTCDL